MSSETSAVATPAAPVVTMQVSRLRIEGAFARHGIVRPWSAEMEALVQSLLAAEEVRVRERIALSLAAMRRRRRRGRYVRAPRQSAEELRAARERYRAVYLRSPTGDADADRESESEMSDRVWYDHSAQPRVPVTPTLMDVDDPASSGRTVHGRTRRRRNADAMLVDALHPDYRGPLQDALDDVTPSPSASKRSRTQRSPDLTMVPTAELVGLPVGTPVAPTHAELEAAAQVERERKEFEDDQVAEAELHHMFFTQPAAAVDDDDDEDEDEDEDLAHALTVKDERTLAREAAAAQEE